MRTADFDYALPPELIAQTPAHPRDASRLLVLHRGSSALEHHLFREIGTFLRPGDLLVANESRVIPARLYGRKEPTGAHVEMLLLNKRGDGTWEVLLKPGRRVKPGVTVRVESPAGRPEMTEPLVARVVDVTAAGGRVVAFSRPVEPLLDGLGVVPLPPYIHTPLSDPERYQTVYAREPGSVAAPTAGLHFSEEVIARLRERGAALAAVTLHVGYGTFLPITAAQVEDHVMEEEHFVLEPGDVVRIDTGTYTLTSTVDGSPIGNANVWITTDEGGSNIIASAVTNDFGVATFWLDAGTVYVWRSKTGWVFDNPDTEVVS